MKISPWLFVSFYSTRFLWHFFPFCGKKSNFRLASWLYTFCYNIPLCCFKPVQEVSRARLNLMTSSCSIIYFLLFIIQSIIRHGNLKKFANTYRTTQRMEYPPPSPSYMSNHAQLQYQYPQSPGPPRQLYNPQLQVIICQKHSFLRQLTQNMTADCSLNYEFSTRKLQVQYLHVV